MTLKQLNAILNIINLGTEQVLSENDAYKTIMSKLRKEVAKAHPDNNGNAEDFQHYHQLYEILQSYKENDTEKEEHLRNKLCQLQIAIMSNTVELDSANINFDEILDDIGVYVPPMKMFQVNISELVLHFNKLRYCRICEQSNATSNMTFVIIRFAAMEYDGTEHHSSILSTASWMPYNNAGAYTTRTSLSLMKNSKLTISVQGFEESREIITENSQVYVINFEENCVKLRLELQIVLQ